MSKRLPALLDDAEFRKIRRAAQARKLTVAAFIADSPYERARQQRSG
jgi:uncharacterized protein (DUF1778 family)